MFQRFPNLTSDGFRFCATHVARCIAYRRVRAASLPLGLRLQGAGI
jgi:hypothetical protein